MIVMGYLNTKVGGEQNPLQEIVGKHGLGERNTRGDLWVDWCATHEQVIMNTWFQIHQRQDCRTVKETMLTEQCQVIEQLDVAHKSNLMHSQIKLVTGRKRGNNTTTCIEDKNGDIIIEKDEILSRWSEYIGELYNDDNRGDMPDIVAEVESPITRREVEHALRGMPEKKSPGPDGITTEMLVAAGKVGILELTELSNMIHKQGSFPSELNKSIFITLPKVNGTIKCEKHRTISLMSHVTKLVLRIVINRII